MVSCMFNVLSNNEDIGVYDMPEAPRKGDKIVARNNMIYVVLDVAWYLDLGTAYIALQFVGKTERSK